MSDPDRWSGLPARWTEYAAPGRLNGSSGVSADTSPVADDTSAARDGTSLVSDDTSAALDDTSPVSDDTCVALDGTSPVVDGEFVSPSDGAVDDGDRVDDASVVVGGVREPDATVGPESAVSVGSVEPVGLVVSELLPRIASTDLELAPEPQSSGSWHATSPSSAPEPQTLGSSRDEGGVAILLDGTSLVVDGEFVSPSDGAVDDGDRVDDASVVVGGVREPDATVGPEPAVSVGSVEPVGLVVSELLPRIASTDLELAPEPQSSGSWRATSPSSAPEPQTLGSSRDEGGVDFARDEGGVDSARDEGSRAAAGRAALEAILLVVDEPVSEVLLAQVLEQPTKEVGAMLRALAAEFDREQRGWDLQKVSAGWRLYTRSEYAPYVERFVLDGQAARLTQAALETLAVVAYKQPVTRSRVAAIRGVGVDGVIRTLLTRGLIESCGTEPETGAHLYRTTGLFLEKLGLDSLDELPSLAPLLPDVDGIDVDDIDVDVPARGRTGPGRTAAGGSATGTGSTGTGSTSTGGDDVNVTG